MKPLILKSTMATDSLEDAEDIAGRPLDMSMHTLVPSANDPDRGICSQSAAGKVLNPKERGRQELKPYALALSRPQLVM